MCGIAGSLAFRDIGEDRPDLLRRACDAMAHRGPDAAGYLHEGPVSLGHRRLSIIDLSDAANQPFPDATGRYVAVFNGEIYNFRELRDSLAGHSFRTSGDTEVLLAAFAKWGPACIGRLKGMFAFAVWDRQEQTLFLCRDRLGVKPLYYHHADGVFLFASELRALLATGLVPRKLDRPALADYLSFQSFGFPSSPIEGIRQLEAGSWMTVSAAGIQSQVYWKPGSTAPTEDMHDAGRVRSRIRELLTASVERRLVSDVPIGAFLSGGIDSSAVVGLMAETGARRPATFNISFAEEAFDESRYAEIIARKFDTEHTVIRLSPDHFLEGLVEALDAMDTPSGDGPNTYMVSKAIRRAGLTVALSGVGGDELFAGYPFFKTHLQLQRWRKAMSAGKVLRKWAAGMLEKSHSGRMQRLAGIMDAESPDISRTYPEFRRIVTRRQMEAITTLSGADPEGLEMQLAAYQPAFDRLPLLSQVSVAEYMGYTRHTLLKDTDQMSMAVSLEVREPFFDHDLVDFVLQVPDALKFPAYPKSLLVESLKPLLPDEIVHRRKQGFVLPWEVWMRGPLRDFCEKRIEALCARDFIRPDGLRRFWQAFQRREASVRYTDVWVFVVLGYWMERNGVE